MEKTTDNESWTVAETASSTLPKKYIDRIFMRLMAIYGHKFISLFPDDDALAIAKAEWGNALARLSSFQIGQALDRCRVISDWNPNIPEFLRLATNLPTVDQAIHRVIHREIIDPVTQEISRMIGGYDLRRNSTTELKKQIRQLYLEAYERVIDKEQGKSENWQPPVQIEHKEEEKKVKRTPEVGMAAINEIKQSLAK